MSAPVPGVGRSELDRLVREAIDRSELVIEVRAIKRGARHYIGDAGEAAFAGTWVNFDAGGHATTPPAARDAYWYVANGRCYLGGVIKTGVSGTTAFTLPVVPLVGVIQMPMFASGGVASLVVTAAGAVQPTNVGGTAVATFSFLDGLSFEIQ